MKKLLIIVDYQKDFVDGSLGFEEAKQLEQPIFEKIQQYKKEGQDIVFTMDTHDENYMQTNEGKHLPIPHCIKNTKGWELYGKIKQAYEKQFPMFLKSTFASYELGTFLYGKQYKEIELVGVVSNICVISNAVIAKAALPNAQIIVDTNYTASFDKNLNEAAFLVMEGFHVQIKNKNE